MPRLILPALVFTLLAAPAFGEYQLEIGPDTTVIDGPVNPDGTINYLAYLNKKLSEGVTPENNFAVDVAMVMGEDAWPSEAYREKVFKRLGVDPPAPGRQVFETYSDHLGELSYQQRIKDPRWLHFEEALDHPWSAKEYPVVKRWLDEQGEVLDRIVRGSVKERFYIPLCVEAGETEAIYMVPLLGVPDLVGLSQGLTARAQLAIADGDLEAAWVDVLAIYRMTDLLMRGSQLYDWRTGVSLQLKAKSVLDDIASSDQLTPEMAAAMIADFQALRPLASYAVYYDEAIRLGVLDAVVRCIQGGELATIRSLCDTLSFDGFDPNLSLRTINTWFDRYVQASGHEDFGVRNKAVNAAVNALLKQYALAMQLLMGQEKASKRLRSKAEEDKRITELRTYVVVYFTVMSSDGSLVHLEQTEAEIRRQLVPVVLAIGGYHAEHGEFPSKLKALVPQYVDSLPTDLMTGRLPKYRVEDGAAVIYSLGMDREDGGGVLDHLLMGDIVYRIEH